MDQASAFGAAGTIVLGGSVYNLSKLKIKDIGKIQAWVKEQIRHPFHVVKEALDILRPTAPEPVKPSSQKTVAYMSKEEREAYFSALAKYEQDVKEWSRAQVEYQQNRELLLLDAKDDLANPNSIDKKSASSVIRSVNGMAYMLWLSISSNHPQVTFEFVLENVSEMDLDEVESKVNKIQQIDPQLMEEMEAKKQGTGADQNPT